MDLSRLPELIAPDSTTTVEKALTALREAICRGWLPAGSQLKQDNLAEELSVSRIPVREALRLLEAEGLIVFPPHQGAVVSGLSWGEAPGAARPPGRPGIDRSPPGRAPAGPDRPGPGRRLAGPGGRIGPRRPWSDDWSFHASLYQAADRPRMLTMIAGLYPQPGPVQSRAAFRVTVNKNQTLTEHRSLLEACRQRRIEASVDRLVRHVESEGRRLTALMRGLEASGKITGPARPPDKS